MEKVKCTNEILTYHQWSDPGRCVTISSQSTFLLQNQQIWLCILFLLICIKVITTRQNFKEGESRKLSSKIDSNKIDQLIPGIAKISRPDVLSLSRLTFYSLSGGLRTRENHNNNIK